VHAQWSVHVHVTSAEPLINRLASLAYWRAITGANLNHRFEIDRVVGLQLKSYNQYYGSDNKRSFISTGCKLSLSIIIIGIACDGRKKKYLLNLAGASSIIFFSPKMGTFSFLDFVVTCCTYSEEEIKVHTVVPCAVVCRAVLQLQRCTYCYSATCSWKL
jgi:hypothetical protein